MPDRRPTTDDEREQVADLHAAGVGRNEIARRLKIHQARVSRIAKELGLTFARSTHTAAATEAKVADGKKRRADLADRLLTDAERLRQQLFARCQVYSFGGKDNTFETAFIDQPSMRDQRDLMSAIGIAIDRAIKLDAYDKADESLSGLDIWLAAMGAK